MKKIAFLLLVFIYQLSYSQQSKNFESRISYNQIAKSKTDGAGCLTAGYYFPEELFTPSCQGRNEQIHTAVMYGSYSNVNVTAGVEYTFIIYSENTTAKTSYITISDEEGTTVYASGYDTIKWTATKDEVVRYYVHADDQCGTNNDLVKKYIRCGDIPAEPAYGCNQDYQGPFWAACSVSGDTGYLAADDFFVPKDSEAFKLKSLKFLLLPLAENDDFEKFSIEVRKDNNNSPGDVIASYENLVPTEVTRHSEDFVIYPTFWASLTIPNGGLEIPVNKDENTRYWLTLQVWSKTGQNIFITNFQRIQGWATNPTFQSLDNKESWITTTWEEDPGLEGNWSFISDCSKLGVNDIETESISLYPNPVHHTLNVSSKKQIKEISILSLTGQTLLSSIQPKNHQMDVSSLASGIYLVNVKLENGVLQTFKMIKK
ncbi:T9SS type A sorting domain-containing protein [Epilithonimonas zeae]|uniref:T9SS type A sorting domain-containing protein n=1 Tax=Epilithonimonas zeae TaxID=1416779 RepID=UPI00200C2BA2|nr:T9SS type A sorting domain-containing protein [Epilithonimonas zeae]UQB70493.1 T9SS type A sorting domain-containing protein [Epilithonimonas zeae]